MHRAISMTQHRLQKHRDSWNYFGSPALSPRSRLRNWVSSKPGQAPRLPYETPDVLIGADNWELGEMSGRYEQLYEAAYGASPSRGEE